MLNNQIIVTDDTLRAYARRNFEGIVDAVELSSDEWAELCARNANSPRARVVQCGFCWKDHGAVQWLKTFTRLGTRVASHQAGEAQDHPYESVETPEHKAFANRVVILGEREGYQPRREAWAGDLKTRADVLLTGTLTIAYEHQHSPFSATGRYSAPERNRLAAAAGRTAMWHSTSDKVRGQVPILRTDPGLPPQVIENPNYRHEFRGGIYRIEVYTCTVRDGHECPDRRFSGCGKPHARGQITAGELDDVLRGAPVGTFMPVSDASVIRAPKFFWTDRVSYDRYISALGGDGMTLLEGSPVDRARTRRGTRDGHSPRKAAELEAMHAQAVDLSAIAAAVTGHPTLTMPEAPESQTVGETRPTDGTCAQWIGAELRYCSSSDGTRRWINGYRCEAHNPRTLAGLPPLPESPGWPSLRGRSK